MSYLCVICARGGSQGIKNKALVKINGKPLLSFTINQAIKSKIFSEVIFSVDAGTKETYEKIRFKGKFDRVVKNIELFNNKR